MLRCALFQEGNITNIVTTWINGTNGTHSIVVISFSRIKFGIRTPNRELTLTSNIDLTTSVVSLFNQLLSCGHSLNP